MSNTAQNILRKINYIEADMDIQKQILFSIPSEEKQEMEKVLKIIAGQKEEINTLRQEMKKAAPEEYEKILMFEKAAQKFKALAAEKKFKDVSSFDGTTPCTVSLKDGTSMDCLVKAQDDAGDWTVMTLDGKIQTFQADSVV
ncbi:hypothetical protein SAMN02746065_101132 [Desulfocicer vacuolatum DSM 3385]|uniref:Uncharacterized protein n=1 Tax=Desulfocicer vacuolatum DSM 3385 TaxID=1121400 RepID=A0A1W1YK89_9BACT|nr:hypothetical protein [Desulfocicer vacuolatum]SMC36559.1 hypothetical protein SAMN02746065_101132 [Desulfocicer vacuolatum DSM 3385]